ncbi:MAG: zinc-binding alcohol dehydrogenase [bacterium]|nr:zinc-binding alcohol dehydrogenase [bacterium]
MAQAEKREIELGYSFVGIIVEKGQKFNLNEGERILALAPHASYVKLKATPSHLVKVPEGVPPDIATIGILGSVAFHIIERAEIKLCESVGILGLGMVGSLCLQLSKICGARPVIGIDINEHRLEIAKEILGIGGRLILTSFTNEFIYFRVHNDIVDKELKIIGAHQPKCPIEKVPYYPFSQVKNRILTLEFLKDGILKVNKLITHRIKKDKIPETYSLLIENDIRSTRILIDWR